MEVAIRISVKGVVQGVGFRPFVFRLARETGICGWVQNTGEGVGILAQAEKQSVSQFISSIRRLAPTAAVIEKMEWRKVKFSALNSFEIKSSEAPTHEFTGICPDIAVCPDCLEDMETQPHRAMYPFVNCTNCGPRYSIINDMPYDREMTSMAGFAMCKTCRSEFGNPDDRRFHAQPVACLDCGPEYRLIREGEAITGTRAIMNELAFLLASGKIIAMKGLGGYHLACDPFCDEAVLRLRREKNREGKPLALMFRDMETLAGYARINRTEQKTLSGWQRPIVLLDLKKKIEKSGILRHVNGGLSTIGAFLPYMPLHYLLFRYHPGDAIVLTSANPGSEPVITDDQEALSVLGTLAAAVLVNNRMIVNRTDDSVVQVVGQKVRLIRRSRGYVPLQVSTTLNVDNIVAYGAELSAAFCIGRGNQAIPGPYAGDLKNLATNQAYQETMNDFIRLFRVKPELIACDLHPGYFSTQLAEKNVHLPVIHIQHHHAHIASCMAEHGLDEKVIGVAFDGTGYGTDGRIWGGEFLVCDLLTMKRATHFEYISLPGGDKAVEEPWRTAVAYLYRVFGSEFLNFDLPLNSPGNRERNRFIMNMIDNKVNCPEVSSAGRLFDAVAAILGVCLISTFQAEAPARLESLVIPGYVQGYSYQRDKIIRVDGMIREIVRDFLDGVSPALIATKFHATIISIIFDTVIAINRKEKTSKIILSGGVFQNRYLLGGVEKRLKHAGMQVYTNEKMPVNDGGIALGQLAIAAKMRSKGCV